MDKARINTDKVYGLAWVKFTEELQDKVKGLDDYYSKSEDSTHFFDSDKQWRIFV